MDGKKIVTAVQLAEGYVQFVNGVLIKLRFTGVEKQADGTYVVDWPPIDQPDLSGGMPIFDARSAAYWR